VFVCHVDKATLVHIQGRNIMFKEDDDLQLLISPFITARKIAGIYWVIFSCFNFVYNPNLVSCWHCDYLTVSPNAKLNVIT